MKYTLKSIKKTQVYKANVDAVRALYPQHVDDFARELMIAINDAISRELYFGDMGAFGDICAQFSWHASPQGYESWKKLSCEITRYNKIMGRK